MNIKKSILTVLATLLLTVSTVFGFNFTVVNDLPGSVYIKSYILTINDIGQYAPIQIVQNLKLLPGEKVTWMDLDDNKVYGIEVTNSNNEVFIQNRMNPLPEGCNHIAIALTTQGTMVACIETKI